MRKDGKRIKRVDPMYTIIPYILDKRYDAMNNIELDIPMEPMQKYLNQKRKEGYHISHMGLLVAAILRTTAEFPALNRFIVNKKIYARNEFCVGLVVLKPGSDDATMNKIYFELEDDIFTVQEKIDKYINDNRKTDNSNSTDELMTKLLAIPGLLNTAVTVLKWMDRHNIMPRAVIEASPFHATLGITNLASIRTNHIHHHIYEFGTMGMFIAMGNSRVIPVDKAGNIEFVKSLPLGVVMDERIASGSYFAAAFQKIKLYLKNPELLEKPAEIVNRDFPIEKNWLSYKKAQKKK